MLVPILHTLLLRKLTAWAGNCPHCMTVYCLQGKRGTVIQKDNLPKFI